MTLNWIILWTAAAILVIVSGLLSASLLRVRRKPGSNLEAEQKYDHNVTLEIVWTVIPAGLLLLILALTFQAVRATATAPASGLAAAPGFEQAAPDATPGKQLYLAHCLSCHAINGQGGQLGPDLTSVYSQQGELYVRESILKPDAVIVQPCPTGACRSGLMPHNYGQLLAEEELTSLVIYLQTSATAPD